MGNKQEVLSPSFEVIFLFKIHRCVQAFSFFLFSVIYDQGFKIILILGIYVNNLYLNGSEDIIQKKRNSLQELYNIILAMLCWHFEMLFEMLIYVCKIAVHNLLPI